MSPEKQEEIADEILKLIADAKRLNWLEKSPDRLNMVLGVIVNEKDMTIRKAIDRLIPLYSLVGED